MLPDTKLILGGWDESLGAQSNLDRVRRDNLLGKASRSRVEDILAIFRQRYVADPELLGAIIMLPS